MGQVPPARAFCQPRILRYTARDVTDIFAMISLRDVASTTNYSF